jgi:hypothetical protein
MIAAAVKFAIRHKTADAPIDRITGGGNAPGKLRIGQRFAQFRGEHRAGIDINRPADRRIEQPARLRRSIEAPK